MSGQEFGGLVSQMRTSEWLASEDFEGLGDVKMTIDHVEKHANVKMQDGRNLKELFAVAFAGKEKRLVLNATNRRTLAHAYGARVTEWKGKPVVIYVQDGVRKPGGASGETCKGLRLRIPKANGGDANG